MKCAGSKVARLVSVFTTLIVIYKAEQEKFLIRDVEKSEKSAREPQLGYAILEKFSLLLVFTFVVSLGQNKGQRLSTADL